MFEEKFQGYIGDKIQLFYMKKFQYRENRSRYSFCYRETIVWETKLWLLNSLSETQVARN